MISVCIATYNGEKYIRPQIESIIVQLDPEDEIVISDDGSTDDTLNIIASFADDRIKVFDHSRDKKQKVKYSFEHVTCNFENALRPRRHLVSRQSSNRKAIVRKQRLPAYSARLFGNRCRRNGDKRIVFCSE